MVNLVCCVKVEWWGRLFGEGGAVLVLESREFEGAPRGCFVFLAMILDRFDDPEYRKHIG